MPTKPEDEEKRVDNPIWDLVGWGVFQGAVLIVRGVWALIVFLVSAVTD